MSKNQPHCIPCMKKHGKRYKIKGCTCDEAAPMFNLRF